MEHFYKGRRAIFLKRLFRMAGCQAESKAALISRKAQQVDIFFFSLFSIRLIRERDAVSVNSRSNNLRQIGWRADGEEMSVERGEDISCVRDLCTVED